MPKIRRPAPDLGVPTVPDWCARLRRARQAAGYTQEAAAKALGVARQSYSRYEDDRVPSVEKMYEFMIVMGLDSRIIFPEMAPGRKKIQAAS